MHFILEDYKNAKSFEEQCTLKGVYEQFAAADISNALAVYYIVYLNTICRNMSEEILVDVFETQDMQDIKSPLLNFMNGFLRSCSKISMSKEEKTSLLKSVMLEIFQAQLLTKSWVRKKQCFVFDKDFLSELAETSEMEKTFVMQKEIFEHLPYNTFYLDFSGNEELANNMDCDGMLVYIHNMDKMCISELGLSIYNVGDTTCLMYRRYKNKKPNGIMGLVFGIKENSVNVVEPSTKVLLQSILYLSSYEPDIRESIASKQRYRQAKQNKKSSKVDMPEREYKVGERFGNAFRIWTKSTTGSGTSSEPTGSHKRPHTRKAHWHSFWIGKRDTPERRLVVKWVSEMFIGLKENEAEEKLDIVNHKVEKQ